MSPQLPHWFLIILYPLPPIPFHFFTLPTPFSVENKSQVVILFVPLSSHCSSFFLSFFRFLKSHDTTVFRGGKGTVEQTNIDYRPQFLAEKNAKIRQKIKTKLEKIREKEIYFTQKNRILKVANSLFPAFYLFLFDKKFLKNREVFPEKCCKSSRTSSLQSVAYHSIIESAVSYHLSYYQVFDSSMSSFFDSWTNSDKILQIFSGKRGNVGFLKKIYSQFLQLRCGRGAV